MVIKSSKQYTEMIIASFGCIVAFSFLLLSVANDTLFVVFSVLLLTILVVRYWVTVGRTLVMDEDGCTVQFLWYHKHYKWNELETRRVEDYTGSLGYLQPYTAGAIFFRKKTKKPAWLMPVEYSILVHPFSFFFVYFDPHIQYKKWEYRCPDIYVIDEEEFRKCMVNWNVDLHDTRAG